MGKATRIFRLTNLDTSETKLVSLADSENITERHFRGLEYNSVLRTDTVPLKFPRDGGRIFDRGGYYFILDAKEITGIKTNIQLDIERLNPFTDDYDPSFTGVLDFNPNNGYSKEDEYINVKVVDSRKLAKFKERDEIEYNVFDLVSSDNITVPDFDNPYTEATYLPIDVSLKCVSNGYYFGTETLESELTEEVSVDFPYWGELEINEIVDRVNIDTPQTSLTLYDNSTTEVSVIQDIVIDYNCNFNIELFRSFGAGGYTVKVGFSFKTYNASGTLQEAESRYYSIFEKTGSTSSSDTLNIIKDESVPIEKISVLPNGGRIDFSLLFSIETSGPVTYDATLILSDDFLSITNFGFYEKTEGWRENIIRGMYPFEVGNRLIQLMTSETDRRNILESNILGRTDSEFRSYPSDGLLSREFATNGYQLRQFTDRALNISFKDWFTSLSAISPIGLRYDKERDIFKIEDIEEFYKSELFPINLGQIRNIKTTDFKELYFSTILSGYPKVEYENFNGVNEVNSLTEHDISIEVKNKFNARSTYYGDSQGQEQARRKNISKYASEDTKYDNNIYLTTLNTSNETIQGDLFNLSGFNGVELLYNLRKTPKQNLQRQSPLIGAPIYKDDSEIISFRKSSKDTNIRYFDPVKLFTFNEFDNITLFRLRERLIDPELDEFEGLYTELIANEINRDPHRIMPYSDREGNNKYGYIWDVEGNRITGKAIYRLIKCNPNRIP